MTNVKYFNINNIIIFINYMIFYLWPIYNYNKNKLDYSENSRENRAGKAGEFTCGQMLSPPK